MKFDPIKLASQLPHPLLKKRALDFFLSLGIPFNRWLGFHIEELAPAAVIVRSPPRTLRKNHVGGAHACALALLGEYPAGLLIAQNFPIDQYRFIITELFIEYHKQGRGHLTGAARAPTTWPEPQEDGETWVELTTHITNSAQETVALCRTKWQIKPWSLVRKK